MPTYEYECSKCGHQFEHFQSMKDKPITVCPRTLCPQKKWGKGKVKKRISAGGGLLFKGSGFYITDYRSEGYKSAAKKDTAPASASASTTSTTSTPTAAAKSASAGGNGSGGKSSSGGSTAAKK